MDWTKENIIRLLNLRLQTPRLTLANIAVKMGCTKNSIIGKLHRSGITIDTPDDDIKVALDIVARARTGVALYLKLSRPRPPSAPSAPRPRVASRPRVVVAPSPAPPSPSHAPPIPPAPRPPSPLPPPASPAASSPFPAPRATRAPTFAKEPSSIELLFRSFESTGAGGGCKWPIGDPRDENFHFCGGPRADFRYCVAHKAMGIVSPETTARDMRKFKRFSMGY